ncbi:bromodomain-containing protein DDB_G0270170-like [Galleria mellonella]|uniref:Bromodomain-containing protein DDB_G0270170-like n=1 Tax=Galleria mellonella TaxID=7137 RepID=A0A6J1X6I3_GALME|nr:bromodomain-containing protein DDB_G0270170-like [Galleria mellonella]
MGGCRCSYGSCTVKTDGKTHMFHYPVFDKVRCHQWLVNGNRTDFLNLRVSQLRNRVVCQHHFKDEHFMNYKKDRLKCDAVPTEDGPYCNLKSKVENPSILCDIAVDDIENECLTVSDKKANYSTKYADFLMNNDVKDSNVSTISTIKKENLEQSNNKAIQNIINMKLPNTSNIKYCVTDKFGNIQNNNIIQRENQKINLINNYSSECKQVQPPNMIQKYQTQSMLTSPLSKNSHESFIEIDMAPVKNKSVSILKDNKTAVSMVNPTKNKIKIISEKKISEPFPIPNKLRRISPTSVICGPNTEIRIQSNETDNFNTVISDDKPVEYTIEEVGMKFNDINKEEGPHVDNIAAQKTNKNITIENIEIKQMSNKTPEKSIQNLCATTSPKISLMKTKIPPERVAKIEEKRKFNMKLRDIIESCLDKLDDPYRIVEEVKQKHNTTKEIKQKKVSNNEPNQDKESKISSMHEHSVAILEDRIKKMEETLLRRIDQNSEKINELKFSMLPHPLNTKSVTTQIPVNEESHKRRLYQEISKYLSPNANNIIYEELFLSKYTQKRLTSPPLKRRKARCLL